MSERHGYILMEFSTHKSSSTMLPESKGRHGDGIFAADVRLSIAAVAL
jgi:hypothetical protein